MIITSELAQQIVDHIVPILQQNINIMDDNAIIIGSGQKHRIGTFHKGAKDVLESGSEVEIHPHELERFPGSLPGVNMPITIAQQLIGVVGVSGHPDEVRNAARLVKMVTELILDREVLAEDLRSHSLLQEQFAALLLSDHSKTMAPQLSRQANLLKMDLNLPRLIAVVNVRPLLEDAINTYGAYDLVSSRTRDSLRQLIVSSGLVGNEDLLTFLENRLVFLKHFPCQETEERLVAWGAALLRLLAANNSGILLHLAFGSLVSDPQKLQTSYEEALFALTRCSIENPFRTIFDFGVLASYLLKNPAATKTCIPFRQLRSNLVGDVEAKYDMRKTIACLLENNQNLSRAAQALFIHRNTLVFRLEKLKETTGLCPGQSLDHALLCKMLLEL